MNFATEQRLLIEPFGIETAEREDIAFERNLLIEPFGIETTQQQ